jgi:hypothetical protein
VASFPAYILRTHSTPAWHSFLIQHCCPGFLEPGGCDTPRLQGAAHSYRVRSGGDPIPACILQRLTALLLTLVSK